MQVWLEDSDEDSMFTTTNYLKRKPEIIEKYVDIKWTSEKRVRVLKSFEKFLNEEAEMYGTSSNDILKCILTIYN